MSEDVRHPYVARPDAGQRVIKFRAWVPSLGKMFYPDGSRIHCTGDGYEWAPAVVAIDAPHPPQGTVGMQFTGLLDAGGHEIYEGDVIEKEIESGKGQKALFLGVVRYFGSGFCLAIPGYGSELLYPNAQRNGRVIGNIHENPELVK